jgi:hypothetical protein
MLGFFFSRLPLSGFPLTINGPTGAKLSQLTLSSPHQ